MRKFSQLVFLLMAAIMPGRAELLQVNLTIYGMDWMTCAHIVDVALKKVPGVEKVDVSLTKSLITMKLKPGNTLSIPQLWKLIRDKGYTPKETTISARGDLFNGPGGLQLKVSGTPDVLTLASDPRSAGAWAAAIGGVGRTVIVEGVMSPGKDFKFAVPVRVTTVK